MASPDSLRRTLEFVQKFKAGKRLPFLSSLYDEVVFDGLTLPDSKLSELSRTFLGEELSEVEHDRFWRRGGVMGMRGVRLGNPPHTDVSLLPVAASYQIDDKRPEFVRTTAMVRMRNNQASQGEFTTTLTLPENAAVSGFWLHIGDERVPGRMTEKKSAMWVYQMIRDVTRRDPGILRYTSPDKLGLRVFPLAGHETRTVEIEFLAPAAIDEPVVIGMEHVSLTGGSSQSDAGICLAQSETGATIVLASQAVSRGLPSIRREPYLHFVIDWSAASRLSQPEIASAIEAAKLSVPEAEYGTATLANFEMLAATGEPVSLDALPAAIREAGKLLPRRGGFLAGRAMHSALANYASQFSKLQPGETTFGSYPLFMLLGVENGVDVKSENLAWLAPLVPDVGHYFVMDTVRSSWTARSFDGRRVQPRESFPIHLFALGDSNCAVRAGGIAIGHVHGQAGSDASRITLSVFDSRTDGMTTVDDVVRLQNGAPYAQALSLWRQQQHAIVDPSAAGEGSLRELVLSSRESGILTNATAYIAVESHAQWKMLEAAEKKKLKAGKGFELGETPQSPSVPEPSTGLFVLMAGMLLALQRRR